MAPKLKQTASSSNVAAASTPMSGVPPQEAPISGKEKMASANILNTKGFAPLNFFRSWSIDVEFAGSRLICKRNSRIDEWNAGLMILAFYFVNAILTSMNRTRVWRTSRFETSGRGFSFLRLAFVSQYLENFLSLQVLNFRSGLHVSLAFQSTDASLMCWDPHLNIFFIRKSDWIKRRILITRDVILT